MKFNRRSFIKRIVATSAGVALMPRLGWTYSQSPGGIRKFFVTLPGLTPGGANNFGNYIPVLTPDTKILPGVDFYDIVVKQFTQQLSPDIPPTTFFGFADAKTKDSKYLGGVIVAKRGRTVKIKCTNLLPPRHILPVDPTLITAEGGGRTDRSCIHLHGGLIQWIFDGGPFAWYSNANNPGGFVHGSSFLNGIPGCPGAAYFDYPNNQSARLVWYHDHAYGLTRLNAYAGIASGYLITDDAETKLVATGIIPSLSGAYPLGIPLVIQDKTFYDPALDPTYAEVVAAGAKAGSLWYPYKYEGPPLPSNQYADPNLCSSGTGRWDQGPGTPPPVSVIPEFFGDINLVNGAPYPALPVSRRRYRFRILNGAQARFYNLNLYLADNTADGITLAPSTTETDADGNPLLIPTNAPGPRIIQIGTEGGFLPAPAVLNDPPKPIGYKLQSPLGPDDPTIGNANRYNLLLAPAERADIIVDFRDVPANSEVILYNDAPAPFPGGDIRNDYFTGRPDLTCIGGAAPNQPGLGPDTRIIMKFKVSSITKSSTEDLPFEKTLNALRIALPVVFCETQPSLLISPKGPDKIKTLYEDFDDNGRLRQLLGSPMPSDLLAFPLDTASPGEVQRWKIFNFTGDVHPIHFHLVNVTIRKREQWAFTAGDEGLMPLLDSNGLPYTIPGTARLPDCNELGWKETVRMNPGEVITVDMKFDLPPGQVPFSPRLKASYGINGFEYVWHCHILEHEEHDMMHPLVIV